MLTTKNTNIIFIKETTSTQDYAKSLIKKAGVFEPILIYTDFQKNGRGQKSNKWQSSPKLNILLSLAFKLPSLAYPPHFFSIIAGLSAHKTLTKWVSSNNAPLIKIKWPNDIYYENKKFGGILIETISQGKDLTIIIGMGLNINQINFGEQNHKITSLKKISNVGEDYNRILIINEWLNQIDYYLSLANNQKLTQLINEYNSNLYKINDWITMNNFEGIKLKVQVKSINKNGDIIVLDENKNEITITHNNYNLTWD